MSDRTNRLDLSDEARDYRPEPPVPARQYFRDRSQQIQDHADISPAMKNLAVAWSSDGNYRDALATVERLPGEVARHYQRQFAALEREQLLLSSEIEKTRTGNVCSRQMKDRALALVEAAPELADADRSMAFQKALTTIMRGMAG